MRRHFLATFSLLVVACSQASAQPWSLPLKVDDTNTRVAFQVDSTWHLIEGVTTGLTGTVSQRDPADRKSVESEVHIPVASFSTGSESRDERLREVMAAETFPDVIFRGTTLRGKCAPYDLPPGVSCDDGYEGNLTIRDKTLPLVLPVSLTFAPDGSLHVTGRTVIKWRDFGVEDPSILVATLHEEVTIDFALDLPKYR